MENTDQFDFLIIIPGIISGLALVQLLTGVVSQIQNRTSVKPYWVQLAWAAVLFLLIVQHWYTIYSWRSFGETFVSYLGFMIYPAVLFVASAVLVPSVEHGQAVDCRKSFFANQRWFFTVCTVGLVETMIRSLWQNQSSPFSLDNLIRGAGIGITILLICNKSERVHEGAVVISLALVLIFIFCFSPKFT